MPRSTLDQVKKNMQGVTSSTYDEEILAIQQDVENDINNMLRRYTSLPMQRQLEVELSSIEAEWAAGIFYQRRQTTRDFGNQIIKQAQTRFNNFIMGRFKSIVDAV